ncbi:MAG: potassium-transporting ATPase subunit F [Candidatus Obscuribacterales bacterium]
MAIFDDRLTAAALLLDRRKADGRLNGTGNFVAPPGIGVFAFAFVRRIVELTCSRNRGTEETVMVAIQLVAGITALLLIIYLFVALLKPELFA